MLSLTLACSASSWLTTKRRTSKENQNVTIGTNNGVAINNGSVVINNYESSSNKKQKVDHTDESKSWEIENLEDLLDAWRQYLSASGDKHEYCLEKYHIIECGYSIKCNPKISEGLYNQIGLSGECTVESPFISCFSYCSKILDYMKTRAWKEVESAVIGSQNEKLELVKDQVDFVEEYFRFCLLLFKRNNLYKRLNISESNFSRLLVWPAIEVSIESMELLEFLPGEYLLKSSQEKYSADGCIVNEEDNEMFLLETSGKLMLNEKWKYGYDHVKCTFGALSIFNAAFKKYFFATKETAMKLQIPYLHAMEDSLHLWVLELCSNKLYISNKIKLERVHNILKAMKEEHDSYETQRMLEGSSSSRLSLVEMVNIEIQKPVKGEGYGILLPEEKDENDCSVRFTGINK
ncbi:hypothetical protein RMCBS344292_00689 [Rhizopus microsporus]|nr:hypothetical protein RMCBS344292_00689 [Rhizopus microsporus]